MNQTVMLLVALLLQSIIWMNVRAMRTINVVADRIVFCGKLPKQSNDELERRAAAMRDSFCEILDPPFDDEGKVRLRWLGNESICGAVRLRYLQSVPVVYVHWVEDKDGSETDEKEAEMYMASILGKLTKTGSGQKAETRVIDILEKSKNLHILMAKFVFADYRKVCVVESQQCGYSTEIMQRVLDQKFVPIPHRIHGNIDSLFSRHNYLDRNLMERMKQDADPQQCWKNQRPSLRIHLFSDEKAFINYGSELYDEIAMDSKQIVMTSAADAAQLVRWSWYWHSEPNRMTAFGRNNLHSLKRSALTLCDPQVLNDKNRLSRTLRVLFSIDDRKSKSLLKIFEKMKHSPDYKPIAFGKFMRKSQDLMSLMRDESHRHHFPWGKEQERSKLSLREKSRNLDEFMRKWDGIVMAELRLRKADKWGFWKLFGAVAKETWGLTSAIESPKELAQATSTMILVFWKSIEFYLDPSYTMNVIALGGPDVDRELLKHTCLQSGCSWKAMRRSVQWIDYENGHDDAHKIW